ncbi:hypothetical protein [Pseudocnuella soli]|jgi:hypothetical protein|uniref:hypothetical protein n=1 Tax=Pseudocnuella soli TaxID=2502779 RepID=UPI0010447F0E|nr:hypothetical protein [Pseudocnuella soli]
MKNEKQPTKTRFKDVTAADIKACKGYEDISDELAQKIADAIRVYTEIVYNCFKEGKLEEQKAKVISISKEEYKKAA